MLNTSFPPWPCFTQEEAAAVSNILLSNKVNYWTGEECRKFEDEFASWCGSEYAIALANGTLALEVALRAIGVKPGDEVIVSPRTFMASGSSVVAVGAKPVFADVDYESQNITAESIAQVLSPRTRAVICVHLAGMPCDMDPIMDLAERHNLYVIEDCAQAHGARYKGVSVGSIGHIGAWSFCQDKIMTTGGEGGMVTTNSRDLWSKMWSYKDHGKSWDAVYNTKHPGGFRWMHDSFGSNFRMLEIQAAIGRIQLSRINEWSLKRRQNAQKIWDAAKNIPGLRVTAIPETAEHAAYKCYVFVETKKLKNGWSRDRLIRTISENGVPCYSGSCPEIYRERAFDATGCRPRKRLPIARELGETSMMFLVHPTLDEVHIETTCRVLAEIMQSAVTNSENSGLPKHGPIITSSQVASSGDKIIKF